MKAASFVPHYHLKDQPGFPSHTPLNYQEQNAEFFEIVKNTLIFSLHKNWLCNLYSDLHTLQLPVSSHMSIHRSLGVGGLVTFGNRYFDETINPFLT